MQTKIDPYKHKERYLNWRTSINGEIAGIGKENTEIILKYLDDMEIGRNISNTNKKGSRSYIRLNSIKDRLIFFSKKFKELYGIDKISEINEEQLISFFSSMLNGKIKRKDGKEYIAVDSYSKVFKAFWHWHIKVSRKQNLEIKDITTDLDTRQKKAKWVYLDEEQIKKLAALANYDYKVMIWFLLDTGIRAPTELVNIRVSDFKNDFTQLTIREEISKTFGRTFNIPLCSNLIKEYVKIKNLKEDDTLFLRGIQPCSANKYLKRLATGALGNTRSPAGGNYSDLTMYDFRHNSCCYWLKRKKTESQLMKKFGWKDSSKVYYYSEFLGLEDDTIEEDLLTETQKKGVEKELEIQKRENEILKQEMREIKEMVNSLLLKAQIKICNK